MKLFPSQKKAINNASPKKLFDLIEQYSLNTLGNFKSFKYIGGAFANYETCVTQVKIKEFGQLEIYRPLTIKETMLAKIKFPELVDANLSTSTGFAYKYRTYLAKVIPFCPRLIEKSSQFSAFGYLRNINYSNLEGEEVNLRKISDKDLWLLAMGGINQENINIYEAFKKKITAKDKTRYRGRKKTMRFQLSNYHLSRIHISDLEYYLLSSLQISNGPKDSNSISTYGIGSGITIIKLFE